MTADMHLGEGAIIGLAAGLWAASGVVEGREVVPDTYGRGCQRSSTVLDSCIN